jgi:hypothetical protein
MSNTLLGGKTEELLSIQEKEMTPIVKKLDAFTERVRKDIEKKRISEADGQKLILKATMVVNMLTKT